MPGRARSAGSDQFFARPDRTNRGGIHDHAREVYLVHRSQPRQQHWVKSILYAGLLPLTAAGAASGRWC